MSHQDRPRPPTWSAMAWVTRRTLAKVNSSHMTARQPSVPNLILFMQAPPWIVVFTYFTTNWSSPYVKNSIPRRAGTP